MNSKITKVLLLSALFLSLLSIAAISIGFPVDLSGDPIEGGHPYISPTSSSYLCGDPIPGGHPYGTQSA